MATREPISPSANPTHAANLTSPAPTFLDNTAGNIKIIKQTTNPTIESTMWNVGNPDTPNKSGIPKPTLKISIDTNTNVETDIMIDTDIASATSDLTKYQILENMNVAVLQQANQLPSIALQLLG